MKIEKRCDTCCFYFVMPKYYDGDGFDKDLGHEGRCRIRAPYHNGWPITWGAYYCGEWKRGSLKKEMKPKEV